ncbi:MAG: hypothetical protein AB1498_07600 [bacterium]
MWKKIIYISFLLFLLLYKYSYTAAPSMAGGSGHSAIIKSDGTLWTWGYNNKGQLGDSTNIGKNMPARLGNDNKWVLLSAGDNHTAALKSDGTLWTWGYDSSGQLGDSSNIDKNYPVQIGNDNKWSLISAGGLYNAALKSDGTLWAWGDNTVGQLGDSTNTGKNTPVQIGNENSWILVSAGYQHTLGLKSNGTLWAWGFNYSGQLGDSTGGVETDKNYPIQIGSDKKWVSVSAGEFHSIALKSDGTLWTWGLNDYGQLGDSTNMDKNAPAQVGSDNKWIFISGGYQHTLALKSDGTLWSWGRNTFGQLGDSTNIDRNTPVQVGNDNKWKTVIAGYQHNIGIKSDGTIWTWGYNVYNQLGDSTNINKNYPVQIARDFRWSEASSGINHSTGLKSNGTIWAWGDNSYGQLGDGTNGDSDIPILIDSNNVWTAISAGGNHTIGLKSNGTIWAWGFDSSGQLGDSANIDKNYPIQIGSDNKWVSILAGGNHSIALKSDGTLWSWGYNFYGQLGDSTNISKNYPVQIGTDNKWVSISAGFYHTIALKSDGTLWACGYNLFGQLGDSTTSSKNYPVQIGTDNKWVKVSAGGNHTTALKSDGTIWAWGYNPYGQLGDSTNIAKNYPVQIGTDNKWVSISAGDYHTIALKSDGTIWAWGYNYYGQLGDSTGGIETDKNYPIRVGTDNNWVSIFAGWAHNIAKKSDGTLWSWGYNDYYQLGDGTWADKNYPVQIYNEPPAVYLNANPLYGSPPLNVNLIAEANDPDGEIVSYEWDYEGDAVYDTMTTDSTISRVYNTTSYFDIYYPKVRVTDDGGATGETFTAVMVFNILNPPTANSPVNESKLTDKRPRLTVNNTNSAFEYPLNYFYEVYTDSTFTVLFDSSVAVPGNYSDSTNSWTVTKDCVYGTNYWWKCRSALESTAIYSNWMATSAFSVGEIDNTPPGIDSVYIVDPFNTAVVVNYFKNGQAQNGLIFAKISDNVDLGSSIIFKYKKNGESNSNFIEKIINIDHDIIIRGSIIKSIVILASIDAGKITPSGINYIIEVFDMAGNKTVKNGYLRTEVNNYKIVFPTWTWKMISFPLLLLNEKSFGSVLGPLGDRRVYKWDPFKKEYSKTYDTTFEPGDAFWFKIKEDIPYDSVQIKVNGISVDPGNVPVINLPPGWSQVANPYFYKIASSKIKVGQDTTELYVSDTANIWVENQFLTYDFDSLSGKRSYLDLTNITPEIGFWMKNRSDKNINIIFPQLDADATGAMAVNSPSHKIKNDGWGIKLTVQTKNYIDTNNYIGFMPSAKNTYDYFDLSEPPPVDDEGISLYLPHTDWGRDNGKYRTDYRACGEYGIFNKTNFDFIVEAYRKDTAILSWEIINPPVNYNLILYDKKDNKKINVNDMKNYSLGFTSTDIKREFSIIIEWDNIFPVDSLGMSDLDLNRIIDGEDLSIFSQTFGKSQNDGYWNPDADLNKDSIVDGSDLYILGNNFGKNY